MSAELKAGRLVFATRHGLRIERTLSGMEHVGLHAYGRMERPIGRTDDARVRWQEFLVKTDLVHYEVHAKEWWELLQLLRVK